MPRLDTQCTHTRKPGLSPQLLSYCEASVQLPVAYRHEYLEPMENHSPFVLAGLCHLLFSC